MDKIQKFIKSLGAKEKEAVLLIMLRVKQDFRSIPGLIKLSGYKDLYRVRVGRYRIIFRINGIVSEIMKITKRDEQTYNNL